MDTLKLLKKLTAAGALSGCEDALHNDLRTILEQYGEVRTDGMKNIFCTFGQGPHFLLDAHMDEIGLIVTSITDDGFLKFSASGGVDRRFLPASEVTVLGKRRLRGVVCSVPPHLRSNKEKKVNDISDLAVDIGFSKDEAEKLVEPGDRILFHHQFDELCGSKVVSNCLDDRCGVASLLLTLDRLKKIPAKITVMISAQEEVGTRGATAGAFSVDADEAICVDVSFGYSPQCSKEDCGMVSGGAMIGFSPVLDQAISRSLVKCAEKNHIPYQKEIMNGKTGTNADVITVSKSGVKCGLISIPLRYMHTPSEVIDVKDVEATADLIAAYISERAGEWNA